tara:strand:- start:1580 stop:1729 length:150 start_codon:yes stop_codon:yes gene_type:complete
VFFVVKGNKESSTPYRNAAVNPDKDKAQKNKPRDRNTPRLEEAPLSRGD